MMLAFYIPGDASGAGFGSALIRDDGLPYEAGTWSGDWCSKSSNFREADDLVRRLEALVLAGMIIGHKIVMFTDNLVFELGYYKGHSLSQKLSDIIFRLHKAERDGGFKINVIHVAGTRMKSWGIDGFSRGNLTEGMMAGEDALTFIPLADGADEGSSGRVSKWVNSCWGDWCKVPLVYIDKNRWFGIQHIIGPGLWMPPPVDMQTVMEIFNKDRIAHPWNPHVFVVPCLMTRLWRKNLMKDAKVLFTVQAGDHFGSPSHHEPLIIALVLPVVHGAAYRGPWLVTEMLHVKALVHELESGVQLQILTEPATPRTSCTGWLLVLSVGRC